MNEKPVTISSGMDAILAGSLVQSGHILFLHTSLADRYVVYVIQNSFFCMSHQDEKLFYVTGEKPELIMNKFGNLRGLSVIPSENINDLKTMGGRLRIIIDGVSWDEGFEEFLTENKNNTVLCTYNLSKLEPERIRKLVASHDRLILNTPDITVLSERLLNKLDTGDATVERFVKDYLDIVVLALIANKPMCGMDILDIIHRNFNVLLSPGTIYPLLHRLKKEGLLEYECGIKKKVYKPAKGSEANIQNILNKHRLANELLNDFLKSKEPQVHIT